MIKDGLVKRGVGGSYSVIPGVLLGFGISLVVLWYTNVILLRKRYVREPIDLYVSQMSIGDDGVSPESIIFLSKFSYSFCLGVSPTVDGECDSILYPENVTEVAEWKPYVLRTVKKNTKSASTAPSVESLGWWSYPSEIVGITADPNNLLVLVNKKYKLSSTYVPTGLINLGESGVRNSGHYLGRAVILEDLKRMGLDAKAGGIDLAISNSYRSYSTQQSVYNNWLKRYNYNYSFVDTFSARAGHSQHQLGTTIDFTTSESNDQIGNVFNSTKACAWLAENGWKYGFVLSYPSGAEAVTGYKYEGWHYRYIGVENALALRNSGLVLDEFLALQPVNN